MPTKQDIITAVKNLDLFLRIPELKGAQIQLNSNGTPFVYAGGFNMVFKLEHNSKRWAFRVWHVQLGENQNRYKIISDYLRKTNLSYFADFIYDSKSLLVNGELVDTIRMEWLEGELLKDYIEKNLANKGELEALANRFIDMNMSLRQHKISHGDLQEGNILIDGSGNLKLVDYDSICVPEIEGQHELVTGLVGYQHPSRFKNQTTSIKSDYFSEIVIYLSLIAFSENPNLYSKYQVKDTQYLLFSETDFSDLENSNIYKDLQELSSRIKSLLALLNNALKVNDFRDLNPLSEYIIAPKINHFVVDNDTTITGVEVELSWDVSGADTVIISGGIGSVDSVGERKFKPTVAGPYELIAKNGFGEAKAIQSIFIYPAPVIQHLLIPFPQITQLSTINISIPPFTYTNFENPGQLTINTSQYKINLSSSALIKTPSAKSFDFKIAKVPLLERIKKTLSVIKHELTNEKNSKYVRKK